MSDTTKRGDRHDITLTVNADLTGATVRLLARGGGETRELPAEVTDPAGGVVTHRLDGTLPVGSYRVELEVTIGDQVVTFPNRRYATLVIASDLG